VVATGQTMSRRQWAVGRVLPLGNWASLRSRRMAGLLCHVCDEPSHNLGAHGRSHGIPPSEYKAYFGLRNDQPLLSARLVHARSSGTGPSWDRAPTSASSAPVWSAARRWSGSELTVAKRAARSAHEG
jgi:hypothetical protein